MVGERAERASRPYSATGLALLTAVLTVVIDVATGLHRIDVGRRDLIDTDGYMRYARVVDLVTGRNGWFDGTVHWSNSPYGHSMHWTRPLDALLVVLGAPVAVFRGWVDGIYWAGLVSGPLLHLALAAVVVWAAVPLLGRSAAVLAGLVAALQPLAVSYSSLGRVDHHVLICLLGVALFGAALRLLVASPADSSQHACVGGVAGALALWVSTESLVPIGFVAVALGVDWVVRGPGRIHLAARWAAWLFAGTVVAVLLEQGPAHVLRVEYDRISWLHVVLTGAMAVVLGSLDRADRRAPAARGARRSQVRRALQLSVLAAVAAVLLRLLFPRILGGPFAEVPAEVRRIWLDHVQESQPIWSLDAPLGHAVMLLGAPLLGLVLAVTFARGAQGDRRVQWVAIAGWVFAGGILALTSIRLGFTAESLAAVPIAAWSWRGIERASAQGGPRGAGKRVGWLLLGTIGYLVPSIIVARVEGGAPASTGATACDVPALSRAISQARHRLERPGDRPLAVLANLDLGPEIHVRSGADIVATPHHRDVAGILDARSTMRARPADALPQITARGIDLVAVCPAADLPYLWPIPEGSLYALTAVGRPPAWLRELPVRSDTVRLFEVVAG